MTSATKSIALRQAQGLTRRAGRGGSDQERHDRRFARLMVLPLAVTMLLAIGYPIVTSLWMSFTDYGLTSLTVNGVGAGNYTGAVVDDQFQNAMVVTTTFVVVAVTIELVLGLTIAMALQTQRWAQNVFRSVLIAPMFIAPIAVGLTFRFLLNSQIGIITQIVEGLGISVDFFGTGIALPTLIAMDVWQWTPFMVLLLSAGIVSLPSAPIEAAKMDGAGSVRRFFGVTLPMLRSVIGVALLLRALDAVRVFEYVFATTKGGPGTETVTIQYLIYQTGVQYFRLGSASAMAYILLATIAIIVVAILLIGRRRARA